MRRKNRRNGVQSSVGKGVRERSTSQSHCGLKIKCKTFPSGEGSWAGTGLSGLADWAAVHFYFFSFLYVFLFPNLFSVLNFKQQFNIQINSNIH